MGYLCGNRLKPEVALTSNGQGILTLVEESEQAHYAVPYEINA